MYLIYLTTCSSERCTFICQRETVLLLWVDVKCLVVCVCGGGGVVLGIGNWSWREIEVLFYVGVSCVWLLFVFVDC